MVTKFTFAFGAAVALVILVDLATGQGPPIYNQYLQAQGYRPGSSPQAPAVGPGPYPQRVEYVNSKKAEKELEKAIELGKVGDAPKESLVHGKKFDKESIEERKTEKDYSKSEDYASSTAAPGMFSSLSNSMSDAWNRFSALGRSARSVDLDREDENSKGDAKNGTNEPSGMSGGPTSSGRGIDSYEYLQQRQNGFIYFKVPKYLVCNY